MISIITSSSLSIGHINFINFIEKKCENFGIEVFLNFEDLLCIKYMNDVNGENKIDLFLFFVFFWLITYVFVLEILKNFNALIL